MVQINLLKPDLMKVLLFLRESKTIIGKTKFQKMVFLAKEEEGLDIGFTFTRYNYGPYSFELSNAINSLNEIGLISIHTELFESRDQFPGKIFKFSLTKKGSEILSKHLRSFSRDISKIKKVVSRWNDEPLDSIIKYVYSKYM